MNTRMVRLVRQAAVGLFASLSVVACGGGSDGSEDGGAPGSSAEMAKAQDKRVYQDAVTVR